MDYAICLCYSSEKGFYTKYSSAPRGEDEVIFRSHEKRGYKEHRIEIPEAQIEIKISTNFGYGSVSYLLATISKDGIPILDFLPEKLRVLNHADVQTFVAQPKDWEGLFKQIIDAIANFNTEKYYTAALNYIDELSKFPQMQTLVVKRYLHSEKSTQWDKKSLILHQTSKRVNNLLCQLLLTKIDKEDLITRCKTLCLEYAEVIVKNYPLFDQWDGRNSNVEDAMLSVHRYLHGQKASNLFIEKLIFLRKEDTIEPETTSTGTHPWFRK